jgi:toxin ParE1/3/4
VTFSVVILKSAEQDLKEIKRYIAGKFGLEVWQATLTTLRESIHTLQTHPHAGRIPDELSTLNPGQYRQIISGMNRIIYEIRAQTIYIHIVCDSRRDMQRVLMQRIIRFE